MKEKIKKFWEWWCDVENHLGLIMIWIWFIALCLAICVAKDVLS